jgi:endonuclease-3
LEYAMAKNESSGKLREIMAVLGPMYPDHRPFLNFENPFQLLVATVLAAQCMDKLVNTVTPELFRRFPDPAALADAPLVDVEKIIRPTTFFKAKAHNIKALSRMIAERHSGEVPASMEELTAMPGVGRKAAGVVMSVCFGQPAIVVDTHFSRVSRRLGLTRSEKPEEIERNIAAISGREDWIAVSSVLNRFGRAICHARKPECGVCPVREYCEEKG